MIKPTTRQLASDENANVPKFQFSSYQVGKDYYNNGNIIDFVTDGKSLYVCIVEEIVTTHTNIEDQDGFLKLISQGEQGAQGIPGEDGAPGSTPSFTFRWADKQLLISENGVVKAASPDLSGPAWKPVLNGDNLTWTLTKDGTVPESINLHDLTAPERPILLRTNSDNTKRSDEESGPANFIQWKYEGDAEWTNLISISELMNLALAGVSFWTDNEGYWHFGHKEVVRATYTSDSSGREIISDVELGDILFDAGAIPFLNYELDFSEIKTRLSEIEGRLQNIVNDIDLSDYYTISQANARFLTEHQRLKTINGESLVGTGNISIPTGGSGGEDDIDHSVFVRSVNGITPVNGNVTISVGNNGVVDLKIENDALYKRMGENAEWLYVGDVNRGNGGTSGGTDLSNLKLRIGNPNSSAERNKLYISYDGGSTYSLVGEFADTVADLQPYKTWSETLAYLGDNFYTKTQVDNLLSNIPGGGGGTGISYRTFTVYKRTNSGTTAPSVPSNDVVAVWDVANNELTLPSQYTEWRNHPENAAPGAEYLWMTTATFRSSDGSRVNNWETPICLTGIKGNDGADGESVEFIFTLCTDLSAFRNLATPVAPLGQGADDIPTGWEDHPQGIGYYEPRNITTTQTISDQSTEILFAIEAGSIRTYDSSTGQWSAYGAPFIWSMWGEDGVDGDGVEYIFCVTATEEEMVNWRTLIPIIGSSYTQQEFDSRFPNYQSDDWYPTDSLGNANKWTDNPLDVSENQPYEWVAIRKYNGSTGTWGYFSEPRVWGLWGQKTVTSIVTGETYRHPYTCYAFTRSADPDFISKYSVLTAWQYNNQSYANWIAQDPTREIAFYANPIDPAFIYTVRRGNNNQLIVDGSIVWHDTVPNDTTDQLYLIVNHIGDENEAETAWDGPVKWGDQAGFQVEYAEESAATTSVFNKQRTLRTLNEYKDNSIEGVNETAWRTAVQQDGCGVWGDDDMVNDPVYMASCYKNSNGVWSNWVVAKIKGEDGADGSDGLPGTDGSDGTAVEYVYYRKYKNGNVPSLNANRGTYSKTGEGSVVDVEPYTDEFYPLSTTPGSPNDGTYWHDSPSGVSEDWPEEYVATRISVIDNKKRRWLAFGAPTLWSKWGANGRDGDGVEYVYILSNIESGPEAGHVKDTRENPNAAWVYDPSTLDPNTTTNFQRKDLEYIPNGWTDEPQGVTEQWPYEFCCVRKYNGTTGKWENFSEPALWASRIKGDRGPKGEDGTSFAPIGTINALLSDYNSCTNGQSGWMSALASYNSTATMGTSVLITVFDTNNVIDHTDLWVYNGQNPTQYDCANGQVYGWHNSGSLQGTPGQDSYFHQKFASEVTNANLQTNAYDTINGDRYYYRKNVPTSDGNKWLELTPVVANVTEHRGEYPGEYIGTYADFNSEDSLEITDYTWVKWTGDDGYGMEQIFILGNSTPSVNKGTNYANVSSVKVGQSTYSTNSQIQNHYYEYDAVPTFTVNGNTYEWKDRPQETTSTLENCYVSVRKLDVDSLREWQEPTIYTRYTTDGEDADNIEYVYLRNDSKNTAPVIYKTSSDAQSHPGKVNGSTTTNFNQEDFLPASDNNVWWADRPQGIEDVTGRHIEWQSYREVTVENGVKVYSAFSTPVVWSAWGDKGADGDGVEYVFFGTNSDIAPALYENVNGASRGRVWNVSTGRYDISTSPSDTREWYPCINNTATANSAEYFWKDDPIGVDPVNNIYVWVSSRKYDGPTRTWGHFSAPALWAKYAFDGEDSDTKEYVYYRPNWNDGTKPSLFGKLERVNNVTVLSNSATNGTTTRINNASEIEAFGNYDYLPAAQSSNNTVIDRWTDHPQGISADHKHEWISYREITYDANNNPSFGNFTDPVLWSVWGEKGEDGDGVEYIYYRAGNDKVNKSNGTVTLKSNYLPSASFGYDQPLNGWTDNPTGVNRSTPYEFVSMRYSDNGVYQNQAWSTPALWAIYTDPLVVYGPETFVIPADSEGNTPISLAYVLKGGEDVLSNVTWSISDVWSFVEGNGDTVYYTGPEAITWNGTALYHCWENPNDPICYTVDRFPKVGNRCYNATVDYATDILSITRGLPALSVNSSGILTGTISSMPADIFTVRVNATYNGNTVYKDVTFIKSLSGEDGQDGEAYELVTSTDYLPAKRVTNNGWTPAGEFKTFALTAYVTINGVTQTNTTFVVKYSDSTLGLQDITGDCTGANSGGTLGISSTTLNNPTVVEANLQYLEIKATCGSVVLTKTLYPLSDGATGAQGEPGIPYTFCGNWEPCPTKYYHNSTRIDIVKYGSNYYIRNADHDDECESQWTPLYWTPFVGQYKNIATDFLFADNAMIQKLKVAELATDTVPNARITINDGGASGHGDNSIKGYDSNNNLGIWISGNNLGADVFSINDTNTISVNNNAGYYNYENNDSRLSIFSDQLQDNALTSDYITSSIRSNQGCVMNTSSFSIGAAYGNLLELTSVPTLNFHIYNGNTELQYSQFNNPTYVGIDPMDLVLVYQTTVSGTTYYKIEGVLATYQFNSGTWTFDGYKNSPISIVNGRNYWLTVVPSSRTSASVWGADSTVNIGGTWTQLDPMNVHATCVINSTVTVNYCSGSGSYGVNIAPNGILVYFSPNNYLQFVHVGNSVKAKWVTGASGGSSNNLIDSTGTIV